MQKKLTHMIWRSMGESILFGLVLIGTTVYVLNYYGAIRIDDWRKAFEVGLMIVGAGVAVGGAYGYWTSSRLKRRLEQLRDAMLLLEKGNFGRPVPSLGQDEIGILAEQLGRISTKWEEQVTSLQRLSNHNAELAEKARISAVIEERQRLARELHDAVSQQLFAISMTATAVGRTLDKDFEKARRQISLIEEMSSVAQSEMRALLLHLRPVHLEGKRLSQGLVDLLLELRAKVPIDISWEIDDGIRMPKGIEDHLFRIVQEALSNTLRHSKASRLELKLKRLSDHNIRLMVHDNGVGFEPNEAKHASYGIQSMKERVNEIGGSIHIITAPGKGTRIEIRVPVLTEEGGEMKDGSADQSAAGG